VSAFDENFVAYYERERLVPACSPVLRHPAILGR
jgi:hypothetical protein